MKKLDEISKNHPFQVPDGYFERLPMDIQARIEARSTQKISKPYFRYALQYALPALVLIITAVFYLKPDAPSADSMLASVSTEELMVYLQETDISTDELIETMPFDDESVEALESEVYFNFDLEGNTVEEMNVELDNI